MKRTISSISSALVLAGLVLAARPASAKVDVSIFKLRDRSLIANFEDASDDGCFVTQTSITFSESITQIGGPPIIGAPTTLVEVDYANACTGEFYSLTGGTTVQTVHFASDLSSATLAAVVPVTDGVSTNATVTMSIAWAANAPTQRVKNMTVTRNANTITIERFDFQTRAASVSGTISALLPVQGVPTDFDLSRFPEGGQLGKNLDSQRSVTFLHGHP